MIGSTIATILVKAGAEVTIVDAMIKPFGANYSISRKLKIKLKFVLLISKVLRT